MTDTPRGDRTAPPMDGPAASPITPAAASPGPAVRVGGRTSASNYDVVTVLLLLLGGFLAPVVGWLAGVVMLWTGRSWSTGERLLGTLVAPVLAVVAVLAFPLLEDVTGSQFLAVAGIVGVAILVMAATSRRLLTARRARPARVPGA
ncbi:hypothetical protein EV383_1646 [Pseudonocardia sediminis]|uniref:Uncharacterized protein n=1 Tax=Pseudonocardia sediminis TaxID=1397368 RepID=A0A4V2FQH5_PSEST|nr:hypothetical protein [Pseudonocardia sediminis]RZT84790.1 hypothetical protein EV383_1646 [Pseudonocardia sediminis]